MATEFSHPGLVFGLVYACGAILELVVRISQGIPRPLPPALERNNYLVPIVLFLVPMVLWPFVSIYRIMAPIFRLISECTCGPADTDSLDEEDSTPQGKPTDTSSDVEKGSLA